LRRIGKRSGIYDAVSRNIPELAEDDQRAFGSPIGEFRESAGERGPLWFVADEVEGGLIGGGRLGGAAQSSQQFGPCRGKQVGAA
jgi:hypothetical protein